MADLRLYAAVRPTTLATGSVLGATTLTPSVIKDREDNSIGTMATYFGTKAYGVISPGKDREEHFTFTGISAGVLTGVSHITMTAPYTETSGLNEAHSAGEVIVLMTNAPGFYNDFANKQNDETIVGTYTFNELPALDSYEAPTNAAQFAPKGYVDAAALGTATVDKLIVAGTAGETISAGQLIYFDTGTNNEWMKCDADTAGSVDNVLLGIAQGAGTDGNAIAGGVLLKGLDANQSGMTQGDLMYASNTAGAISSSAGTTEVVVGAARSSTTFYFEPRFAQQITEAQQDLLDGITASSAEINITDGLTATTAQLNEAGTFFGLTDITGTEAETLTSSSTSNADTLHTHNGLVSGFQFETMLNTAAASFSELASSGFSDATNDILTVGLGLGGATDDASLVAVYMSEDIGSAPYIFAKSGTVNLGASSSPSATHPLYIGTDTWVSDDTSTVINKNGSPVTISGTNRFGPLGHNNTDSQLLVLYATNKIAKFTGIAGTTITNANDDVTLDTTVSQVGFVFDDTNNRYVCVDKANNLLRKFDSSGTTISTAAYTVDDTKVVGVCLIKDRYYLVMTLATTYSTLNINSITVSLVPTTMTR